MATSSKKASYGSFFIRELQCNTTITRPFFPTKQRHIYYWVLQEKALRASIIFYLKYFAAKMGSFRAKI